MSFSSFQTTVVFLTVLLSAPPVSHACSERQPTPVTFPGPHDFSSAPAETKLWREGDDGEPLLLRARVLDTCGEPVPGARVHVLHANQDGVHQRDRWRARISTDDRGEFQIVTVLPGYAGGMARHIHFIISHPDHQGLVTRLFFKNDPTIEGSNVGDLAMVVDEYPRGDGRGWVAGYEFVLAPK